MIDPSQNKAQWRSHWHFYLHGNAHFMADKKKIGSILNRQKKYFTINLTVFLLINESVKIKMSVLQ